MPSAASTVSSITARSSFVILVLCLSVLAAVPARAASAASPTIVVLGDSLSAAYGIRVEQGWVSLLQARLRAKGYGHRVINASSSGETTGGALARLPRVLAMHRPAVVVVELGANDGLRGLPIADIRSNLESIIQLSQQAGARILLVGMHIPPNYGPSYTRQFHELFGELGRKHRLARVPFLLEDVALDEGYMQDDGLHPTAAAQPLLLAEIWPRLEPLLRRK
ncbi:MAG TPA: arylesterase [Steroidobacteraceae bacterium]|nr:arylesterase [Steroidobacteraceae bacterium]